MMAELEKELTRRNIPFEHDGNRIRCFPHIINIACQTVLAELKKVSELYIEEPPMSNPPTQDELENWDKYLKALEGDLVGRCRNIVASCRSSGQRRHALLKKIDEGNKTGYWKGKLDDGKDQIRLVQLLRDCETRWSSTFNMIDRVLELYIAIRDFLLDLEQSDITDSLVLNPLQKSILQDIHQVLQVAHLAQELLSAERTPTLSMALPVFETLVSKWKKLSSTIPELKHFIDLGVSKLEEYVGKARKTRLYALAMSELISLSMSTF
ncbi:hypothetical protein BDZ97DRAFT_1658870 [Flammula alnicola]|nr:hypothetical protein BDZ97DRAFT_1658870 [Flammula alnicola]